MVSLQQRRESYARLLAAHAGVSAAHQRVIDAFATIPREDFLGPPPWRIFTGMGFVETSSDPALLYQDVLVALKTETHINNGQPSLHMASLAALNIKEGETAIHVGSGTGYYTAILATLVGPSGKVTAYEIDDDLAPRATQNLAGFTHVDVRHQSGADGPLPPADVIYVSAGATAPLEVWTGALRDGGRLLFPLTPDQGAGCMLLVTRLGIDRFAAKCISTAVFIPCIGARDVETGRGLSHAFATRDTARIRSLRYGTEPDDTCWFAGSGWWLSTTPPDSPASVAG
jgi:protein-L-isoaspartate(D-aspartate) O-methyltransferase